MAYQRVGDLLLTVRTARIIRTMQDFSIRRLSAADQHLARRLFLVMADVFGEGPEPLGLPYLENLLSRGDFWALAAFVGDEIVGGITAYSLALTRCEKRELFIYDLAVCVEWRRRGVGRALVSTLRDEAGAEGVEETFVFADDDDIHVLDFYRALGGVAAPVTAFSFTPPEAASKNSR